MIDIFQSLYETQSSGPYRDDNAAFWGGNWCGPDVLPHFGETLIARFSKLPNGDGQDVEVYCFACPTRFYKIKVLPCVNSINQQQSGCSLSTGSSTHELAKDIAKAIAEGMLGLDGRRESEADNERT